MRYANNSTDQLRAMKDRAASKLAATPDDKKLAAKLARFTKALDARLGGAGTVAEEETPEVETPAEEVVKPTKAKKSRKPKADEATA